MRRNESRSSSLVFAALLVGLGACGEAGPLEVQTEASTDFAAAMAVDRPLRQVSSGLLMPAGLCASGVAFAAEGSGVASHLGRYDLSLSWCMDLATGVISSAVATATAANGDLISMEGSGQAVSQTELWFALAIVGGTGRFAGATGAINVTSLVDAAGSWTSSGTGWIAY